MRVALSIIFVGLVAILIFGAISSHRSKKTVGKPVSYLLIALIPPIIGNLFIISSPFETLSTVGCYIYFLGMNLVMGAYVYFTFYYCEINYHKKLIFIIVYSILALDCIQLLINLKTGHAFTMDSIEAFGDVYYQFVPHIGQTIHRIIDYSILGLSFIAFIVKMFTTPKVYREKYAVIIFAMIIVTAWQSFYIFSRTPVDISMTSFGAFGVLVYLLALHYRPLRLLDRMLAAITSKMPDAILFFDTTGKCIWANKKTHEMLGVDDTNSEDIIERLKSKIGDYENKGFGWNETITSGEGDAITSYVVERQHIIDDNNKIVGSYLSVRDNTNEQIALQKETYNATHDGLTGALNRAGFDEVLNKTDLNKIFLLLVDLDSFKQANDEYGHNVGDQVLIEVVEALKKNFREDDYVCRIGGDEFAVIINNADRYTPKFVEERIKRVNAELNNKENKLPNITVSAGGAFGKDAENAYELINNADHAMYQIKFNGKNGFTLFENR